MCCYTVKYIHTSKVKHARLCGEYSKMYVLHIMQPHKETIGNSETLNAAYSAAQTPDHICMLLTMYNTRQLSYET